MSVCCIEIVVCNCRCHSVSNMHCIRLDSIVFRFFILLIFLHILTVSVTDAHECEFNCSLNNYNTTSCSYALRRYQYLHCTNTFVLLQGKYCVNCSACYNNFIFYFLFVHDAHSKSIIMIVQQVSVCVVKILPYAGDDILLK